MNIQEALKETGKAEHSGFNETYHHVGSHNDRPDGKLRWFDIRNVCLAGEVILSDLLSNHWQPYHEVKEIRAEKAGELWVKQGVKWLIINTRDSNLRAVSENGVRWATEELEMIHNKNGWARLFPHVVDNSIERIEIEGVNFIEDLNICIPTSSLGQFSNSSFLKFVGRGPMKMILEIPKEPHECQG